MSFSYSVLDNNVVHIYSDSKPDPVIIQPNWPNGTPWGSTEEAENWAQLCVLAMTDPSAPYAPSGPGLDGDPKPV